MLWRSPPNISRKWSKDVYKRQPLSMVETLQEAAYEQMQAEASQMTASSQLPEAQEQALDEYPMPDEQVRCV